MKKKKIDLILASTSPRRKEILTSIGAQFRIVTVDTDETLEGMMTPENAVCTLADRKCADVLKKMENENDLTKETMIIACDTVVVYEGMIIGKPLDEAHAMLTLGLLSDSRHSVYSGISVYYKGRIASRAARTDVKFRALSEAEIQAYVDSGEPMGKAGSYAIQMRGASFVERIEGEFNNVVGLPVATLLALLHEEFSVEPMDILHYHA